MTRQERAREVEVDEVIPPRKRTSAPEEGTDPLLKLMAHVLDELFKVPGTRIRFGLDPLLGLLPGVGDSVAGLVSTVLLSLGVRRGIPKIVIVRMAANILLNSVIGAIPVLGDAFSFWFKSNVRNYELYQQHAGAVRTSTRTDWIFVGALAVGVALVMLAAVAMVVYFVAQAATQL